MPRFKDLHLDLVAEWREGCLLCGDSNTASLRGLEGLVDLPLCPRHRRWAYASRRERVGKQARRLRLYLLAWCRLRGGDRDAVEEWLNGR